MTPPDELRAARGILLVALLGALFWIAVGAWVALGAPAPVSDSCAFIEYVEAAWNDPNQYVEEAARNGLRDAIDAGLEWSEIRALVVAAIEEER